MLEMPSPSDVRLVCTTCVRNAKVVAFFPHPERDEHVIAAVCCRRVIGTVHGDLVARLADETLTSLSTNDMQHFPDPRRQAERLESIRDDLAARARLYRWAAGDSETW